MTRELVQALRRTQPGYHPGWRQPEFSGWIDEQMSWKTHCYIGDWSFLPSLIIDGPDSITLLQQLAVNSFARFAVGQAKHAVFCNPRGKVIAEGILMRLSDTQFVLHGRPVWWVLYHLEKHPFDVQVWREDSFKYQVQGPTSLSLLQRLTGQDLADIRFMHFKTLPLLGHPVRFLRQGMSGEIGFELQGPNEIAGELYEDIVEVGQQFGLRELGRRTVMINHLEACFPTAGWHYLPAVFDDDMAEFREFMERHLRAEYRIPVALGGSFVGNHISDYYFSPFELGWGKVVKFDHDFIGRSALEAEAANPRRSIVTLEWQKEDVLDIYASYFDEGEPYAFLDWPTQQRWVAWFDRVEVGGTLIGLSTPPGYSFYYRKVLSLAILDREYTAPGTPVTVVWGEPDRRQKAVRALVAPAPYKPDRRRIALVS